MKKVAYLSLFLLGLLITSCQGENDALELEHETDFTVDISEQSKSAHNGILSENSTQDFETYLHWSSFITGRILRTHPEHRIDVINLMGTGNTVPLEDLLANNLLFHNRFRSYLISYIDCCPDPDYERIKPPPPPPPPGPPPFGEPSSEDIADDIIDLLVNDNCIEWYFPSGVDFSGAFEITTTAHPLTTATNNEGILRIYTMAGLDEDEEASLTSEVNVNVGYVNRNSNVIVARPFRMPLEDPDPCPYTEYSNIDFEDFLD